MSVILVDRLAHALIAERHAGAARARRASLARNGSPVRWHWWGPHGTLRRRHHANPIAAIAATLAPGSER